ncbi:MAG: S1 RNA-binding domain-containing protein [Chloroflexota bacterium]
MSKSVSDSSGNLQQDDAYWSALFEQESSSNEPATEQFTSEPSWEVLNSSNSRHLNGSNNISNEYQNPWQIAKNHFDGEKTVQLEVAGFNKGGLLVQWNNIQGFVPASQLLDFPQFHFEAERIRALKSWIGKKLSLKIIELNKDSNRLILSERAAQVAAGQRDNVLGQINIGDTVEGTVTNLTKFGAFVDLGGVEGLIHISELSWSRVLHPSDIVKPGQNIKVTILSVDSRNGRVALSLKRLKHDPWHTVESRFKEGQIVHGTVTNIVSYGAFVLIEEELEGLIHISELAEGSFLHPRNVVAKGDKITAKVLHVNGKAKRLALTLHGVSQA